MTATTTTKRKPRRSFGAVRKLPSGRYQATYWRDGKQHAQTFPAKTTLKEVGQYLSAIEADIVRGKWIDPTTGSDTFRECAEAWLATGVKQQRIRPTTEDKYRGLLDRHLLPTFGSIQLSKITERKVETWFYDLKAEHPSTAAGAYRLLATIFNSVKNVPTPCTIEKASSDPSRKKHSATMAECQAAIDAVPEKYRCAIMLAAWGSLRMSEILGLQHQDVDLTEGTIRVERAYTLARESNKAHLGAPKSEAGIRTLYLPPHVLAGLADHLTDNVEPQKDAWLFPGTNGLPMSHRTLSRVWDRARKTVDRTDLRFHDLRVSGLTWAGQAGATAAELMNRGGHANMSSVEIYQNADAQRDRALAMAMDFVRA